MIIITALKILKKNFQSWRAICAAVFGGIFAVAVFFIPYRFPAAAAGFLFPVFMLYIAYTPDSLREFIQILSVFYALACCMAGVGMIFFFSGKAGGIIKNGIFYMRISSWTLILSAVGFYILLSFVGYILNRKKKHRILNLCIIYKSETILLNVLEDSGNFLKEPVSGKPVIVADKDVLCSEKIDRVFAVPFHSLGCKRGIIYAFKPDKINYRNQTIDAFVGIYDGKLSPAGEYNAVIGCRICE